MLLKALVEKIFSFYRFPWPPDNSRSSLLKVNFAFNYETFATKIKRNSLIKIRDVKKYLRNVNSIRQRWNVATKSSYPELESISGNCPTAVIKSDLVRWASWATWGATNKKLIFVHELEKALAWDRNGCFNFFCWKEVSSERDLDYDATTFFWRNCYRIQ